MNGRPSLLAGATLFEVSPAHVDEGDRIGFLHEDKAAALGRLMAVDGQRDPIKVVANKKNPEKPWRLVTGMHRLIGARIECIPVWAIEVSGTPEDLADLEASENLHRRPLAPIERAKFTAALVQAARDRIAREHGELKQQAMAIKARWDRVKIGETLAQKALTDETGDTCATIAHVYGWEESVGDALGMSRRTIHNDLQLFRLVIEPFPTLVEALSNHPVVGENAKQLRDIAQVKDEGHRRRAIELLLADPELSADEALVQIGLGKVGADATPVAHQKFFNQIKGGWARLSVGLKKQFLPDMAALLDTPGLKADMRDMLDRELNDRMPAEVMKKALSATFDIVARLSIGEHVDDDELEAARHEAQGVLWNLTGETDDAR